MKNSEFKELLKKCFGKEKNDRYHAIAMLTIYGFFLFILIAFIRISGSNNNLEQNLSNTETPSPTATITPSISPDLENYTVSGNDINYSYSYTISYNGTSEVYLGKKVNNKEKFTFIKDGISTNYAILDDYYLVFENGTYHITDHPSQFFKYCDVEKILLMIENEIPIENSETVKYNVSNLNLSSIFQDVLLIDDNQNNLIQLSFFDNNLKGIDLDFSHYISSIDGKTENFTIHMEFADIGTTEDFEIPIS